MPVYRSENGTFYSQFFYRDGRGAKRHKVKRGFTTELEALMWEKDFLAVHNGTMDMLFTDFVDVYATEIRPRIREHTWLTKEYMIKDKIIPFFGKMRMSEINRRRPLAEPAYRPQGCQWQAVLGHVSQNHQQPAKCHLQPCRALLRPDGQPVQEGNEDGLEERRKDELLDEEGVSEVLGGHHGQASFLLCF